MIQLLKIKWLAWTVFSCVRLVTDLIASHTANNLDHGDEAEDEVYESKEP